MSRTEDEVLFGGAAGGAKASDNNALILTPFGWKRMGDIEINDQLINPDGTTQRVIGVYPQPVQDGYRIHFVDGASTVVTIDHIWLVSKTKSNIKADRRYYPFAEDDYVRARLCTTEHIKMFLETQADADGDAYIHNQNLSIPLCEPVNFQKSYRSKEKFIDPYVLGLLIGDGDISKSTITFSSADEEIIGYINEKGYRTKKYSGKYAYKIENDNNLVDNLRFLKLLGTNCETKFIPEYYKWASVEERFAMLQGLMDTDGTATESGKASYCSVSLRLAKDVQHIVWSLGGKANICEAYPTFTYKGVKKNGLKAYNVVISMRNNKECFRLKRKSERARLEYNGGASDLMRRIVGIENVGKIEATCIKVDHPNGLYIADDFIVTHNTESLLHYPVRDLLRIPKLQALYIQRENNRMRDVLVRAQEFFIPLGATYNKTEQIFTFPNGSRYEFGHMEHEESKIRYQGRAFEIICFDELTQFSELQYLYLFSRNRGAFNPNYKAKMRAATNPGGLGHFWCRKRFIDALVPGKTRFFVRLNNEDIRCHPETPYAKSRAFIPSRVTDNPYYRDSSYIANLMALPENERRALLEGDWNAFEGQFFRKWRRNIHVVETFDLPQDWAYFGAYDYGYSSPACYLLAGVNYDGDVHFVREFYQEELSIREQAEAILELESGIKVSARIADNQIFEHRMKSEPGSDDTIDQIFYRESKGKISFGRSNKDRMSGWAAVKEYMAWEGEYNGTLESLTRRPQLYITANCTNAIREVEGAVYAPTGNAQYFSNKSLRVEDLDTRGSDHCLDNIRYLINFIYAPRKIKQRPQTVREMFLEQGRPRPPRGVIKF